MREARAPRSARELDALIAGSEALFHLMEEGDGEGAGQYLRDIIIEYGNTVAAALAP